MDKTNGIDDVGLNAIIPDGQKVADGTQLPKHMNKLASQGKHKNTHRVTLYPCTAVLQTKFEKISPNKESIAKGSPQKVGDNQSALHSAFSKMSINQDQFLSRDRLCCQTLQTRVCL